MAELGVDMTTKSPDDKAPRDAAEDQVRHSLTPGGEAGETAPVDNRELLRRKGAAAMTAEQINLEAIRQFKGYKFGKYALKAQVARLREKPVRTERSRSSGYRPKRS
jgi:hypothetical protein